MPALISEEMSMFWTLHTFYTHVLNKESIPSLKNLYHVKNIQYALNIITKLYMECAPSVNYRTYQLLTGIIKGK